MATQYKNKVKFLAAMVALSSGALAQQQVEEEVVITGIRASLERAMDTKRNATGVVDAISSEDIGKFPDTNLAESMQRITGVSINRRDGEGQQITVRGFGPQFNAVTLNGRQMPNATSGRGFNFDTIAAEMVSGVEVYKTGMASEVSGGIGASVNVKTAKPLILGDKIAGQVKMLSDTSSDELTPAFSGVYSKNVDDRFGVLASLSYQERDFERDSTEVRRWRGDSPLTTVDGNGDPLEVNYHPTQTAVTFTQKERKRTNANLSLQYAVNESMTATLDVNYSDLKVSGRDLESASWRTYSTGEGEYWETDQNGTAVFHQFVDRGMDFFVGAPETREVAEQIGFNFDWAITDDSFLVFDLSTASSERNPNQEKEINRSDVQGVNMDYTFQINGDSAYHYYPVSEVSLNSAKLHQQDVYSNNYLDELDQMRVDYQFDGEQVSFQAGLMYTDQTKFLRSYNTNNGENAGAYDFRGRYSLVGASDALYLTEADASAAGYSVVTLDHAFAGELSLINFDPEAADKVWEDYLFAQSQATLNDDNPDNDFVFKGLQLTQQDDWSEINEKTLSAYMQATVTADLANRPFVVVAGVRVESTSVDSTSLEETLSRLEYVQDGEEYAKIFDGKQSFTDGDSYDVVLPNLSMKYDITENIVGRLAASKTITRPELSKMKSSRTFGGYRDGDDFGSAAAGNPDLKPFMSDNFDLSVEWYFDDTSYVSVGYFKKIVDNFIVSGVEGGGATEFEGVVISDQTVQQTPPGEDPADFTFEAGEAAASYIITRPRNEDTKTVDGLELAVQYSFGESGFGVIANATLVDTDSPFEVDQTDESALLGLSDSANLVGFYDNYGFQARIAYNWRDSFVDKWGHFYGTSNGSPTQADEYSQIDISASYDINDNLTVFLEGINVTSEDTRSYGRYDNQTLTQSEGTARYALGLRASF